MARRGGRPDRRRGRCGGGRVSLLVALLVVACDAPLDHAWSLQLGGVWGDMALGAAAAPDDGVVVIGTFAGAVDFGGGPLTSTGWDGKDGPPDRDLFVARFGPLGEHRWSRLVRGASNWTPPTLGVAVDGSGGAVITGRFTGQLDLGGAILEASNGEDAFLAKLSPEGDLLWARRLGGEGRDFGNGVAVDPGANVVVTGQFEGTVDFGGGPLQALSGSDIFLARYSATGEHLWSRRLGTDEDDGGTAVAVDAAGDVFVTGWYCAGGSYVRCGSPDSAPGAPTASHGDADVFLAKYSAAGDPLWSRGFGGQSYDVGDAVAVDPGGDVALVGQFSHGDFDPGGGTFSAAGTDGFVARYSGRDGSHLWSAHLPGDGGDVLRASVVQVDALVIVGTVEENGPPSRETQILLRGHDSGDGQALWACEFGGEGEDSLSALTASPSGQVFASGSFENVIDLGGGRHWGAGDTDGFVVAFDP